MAELRGLLEHYVGDGSPRIKQWVFYRRNEGRIAEAVRDLTDL